MNEQRDILARAHVTELGSGEIRVEVQDAGAELRRGEADVDESPVVATEDPDRIVPADTAVGEDGGESVGPVVELPEREWSELVDEADPVRMADRGDRDGGAELTEFVERPERLDRLSWRPAAEHPRADHRRQRPSLDDPALRESLGVVERALRELTCVDPGGHVQNLPGSRRKTAAPELWVIRSATRASTSITSAVVRRSPRSGHVARPHGGC